MTIKLKQMTASDGETQLTYEYDDVDGLKSVTLSKSLLDEDVRKSKVDPDKESTEKDYTNLVVKAIEDLRAEKVPVKESIDWEKMIDQELEV